MAAMQFRYVVAVAASWAIALTLGGCDGCTGRNGGGPDAAFADAARCGNDSQCSDAEVCRYNSCVPTPIPCTTTADCVGDNYCDTSASECLPFGVGPGGQFNAECRREPVPGVFLSGAQCEWLGPPAGDAYPDHTNILGTPAVAFLGSEGEFATPAIVFISYNFTDGGPESAQGSDPRYFGVIRVIDGRDCRQLATIATPTVVASSSVALADIGGADAIPEIIAARTDGGLAAWTLVAGQWQLLWRSADNFADNNNNWAGPSVHDLNDDGVPEILLFAAVYDNNGVLLTQAPPAVSGTLPGYIPVVGDLDGDGLPELIAGASTYRWDTATTEWVAKQSLTGGVNGFTAIADFGTFGANAAADNRAVLDGVAEIAVVSRGIVRVFNSLGRLIFTANVQGTPPGSGGPPTIADFDGDGRVEVASAGASAYSVFDMDCLGTPDVATCPSLRTDGVSWSVVSQDLSSNVTGSSVFDFDGDGRAEAVYGDECFTRVYDGVTGKVVYSRFRRSCTWYENPVVADVDADFNAEIISTSNTNCIDITCPSIDPIFDGIACSDDADCPGATACVRDAATDALGRCRCNTDIDCGGDGFVCADPAAGPNANGKVCRASNPGINSAFGLRVLADNLDRWVGTRPIWNQHAYSVTNVDDRGKIPRTSQWLRNWTQPGLNNFRQNSPGTGSPAGAIPDITIKRTKVTCDGGMKATVIADVCNRGTEPVAAGMPFAVYADGEPAPRCTGATDVRLFPGQCVPVSCQWSGSNGPGRAVIDDRGTGVGINCECREDNNTATFSVGCQ